ncbi:MAG: dephospho-CoA kinase [Clostridia bacterium]|nr:dephospho-CoA kinase [Clostridia bacterium]
MDKLILGVTGGSGSGKSQVCSLFSSMGAQIVDADAIAHSITDRDDVHGELRVEFGSGIFNPDGTLNRRALGKIVFSDEKELHILNMITHYRIREAIETAVRESCSNFVVIDAALLVEAKLDTLCTFVIAVVSPRAMRLQRIMERDHIPYDDALARINSQKHDCEYAAQSDFVIINNGGVEELNRRVIEIFQTIRDR